MKSYYIMFLLRPKCLVLDKRPAGTVDTLQSKVRDIKTKKRTLRHGKQPISGYLSRGNESR